MAIRLNELYRPITATPFMSSCAYTEISPCEALAPYICCFWGTKQNITTIASNEIHNGLVIPDTCMDIILDINFTTNRVSNSFCGIQDKNFTTCSEDISATVCTFAVRFYAWAVTLFSDDDMGAVLNAFVDTEHYFKRLKKELETQLLDGETITDRIAITENYLLRRLNKNRENTDVMNAIYKMIHSKGNTTIKKLTNYACISDRQLERLFKMHIGVSPKKLLNMIRYQYLLQDIVYNGNFDVHNAVFEYGFSDQAHLINEFKRYHTMTPLTARKFAFCNK